VTGREKRIVAYKSLVTKPGRKSLLGRPRYRVGRSIMKYIFNRLGRRGLD
jgi:hypothetical protein